MASYTPSLGLELITPGSQSGLWGNTSNNTFNLIDQAVTGVTPISFAAASGTTYTLTDFNGAADEARSAVLNITGTATGSNTVVVPNKQKTYLVRNNTTQDVVFRTPSPSATYTVGAGYSILIFCDGNNNVFTGIASPSVGTLSVNGGGTGATTFGSGGFIKSSGGTNALTASLTVNAASELSGVTPVTNGGTGQSSLTGGALLFGNGTSGVGTFVGTGAGQVATWNGSAWTAATPAPAGVTSLTAGGGILVNGGSGPASGAVTVSNNGVTSLTAGTAISLSGGPTGAITINNIGATSIAAGTGISVSAIGGAYTVTNGGVVSVTAGTGVTITGTATNPIISAVSSGGTVTSVSLGTGTTGLTVSGTTSQTITSSGTFTIGGTLAVANGGTGNTTLDGAGIVTKTGTQTMSGAKTFTGGIVTNAITSPAFNYQAAVSTYYSSGNVVISINSTDTIFYANGDFKIPGSNATKATGTTWINPSDRRLKDNIQSYSAGLNELMQIQPKSWVFNGKGGTTQGTKGVGVIADDMQNVLPDTVTTYKAKLNPEDQEETDIKQFDANDITWVLVNAIKELKAEVDALKAAK